MSNSVRSKSLAGICLWIFLYAQIYTGVHQYNNPLEPVIDCSLIDHHLHQDQETHDCEICDFQLTIHPEPVKFQEATRIPLLTFKHELPSGPFSQFINLRLSRAPPSV